MSQSTNIVVVLDDGETFGPVIGCKILHVPDDLEGDDVDEFVKDHKDLGMTITDLMDASDQLDEIREKIEDKTPGFLHPDTGQSVHDWVADATIG